MGFIMQNSGKNLMKELNRILSARKIPLPEPDGRWIAVIRVRGRPNTRYDVEFTLKLLRLHKPNHCVVIPYTPSYRGMLLKVQHKIAWGDISFEMFRKLILKRGRVIGNKPLTDDIVKQFSKGRFKTVEELIKALWEKKVTFKELDWLKPVFRLRPPRGGYPGGVKRLYQEGGALGYWGPAINKLLKRML